MRAEVQQELVRRFRKLLGNPEPGWAAEPRRYGAEEYTSPLRLAAERRLMRQGPVVAALTADVREPGDYLATEVDGVGLLVLRGYDGKARVFLNACRHRGAPVARGRGRGAKLIACPYHAWTYGLDGRLRRRPLGEACFGEADGERGLVEVDSEEAAGLVLCRLEGGRIDAGAHLGWMADDLESFGLAGHHHVETRSLSLACNWKMVIDTFLEAYHIFSLHTGSISPVFYSQPTLSDCEGPCLRFIGVRRSIETLGDDPAEWDLRPHATIHYLIFPNTLVVHQIDHFEVWRVFPEGDEPGRSRAHASLYAPEPPAGEKALGHWKRNLDILLEVTAGEDFPLCEAIQANLQSGACASVVFGRNEPALVHFHEHLRELLAAQASS